ncbi:ADP-ribosyltransferase [Pseudochelatococcus sp. B33]
MTSFRDSAWTTNAAFFRRPALESDERTLVRFRGEADGSVGHLAATPGNTKREVLWLAGSKEDLIRILKQGIGTQSPRCREFLSRVDAAFAEGNEAKLNYKEVSYLRTEAKKLYGQRMAAHRSAGTSATSTTAKPAFSQFISDIASRAGAIPTDRIKDWQEKAGLYLKVGEVDGVKGRFSDLGVSGENGEPRRFVDTNEEYAPATFTVLYDESHLEERLVAGKTEAEFDKYSEYKDTKGEHPELTTAKRDSAEYQRLKAFEDAVKADEAHVSILEDYTGGLYSVANAALRAGAETPEAIAGLAVYTLWKADRSNAEPADVTRRIAAARAAFDAVAVELPKNITLHRALESSSSFPEGAFDKLAGTVLQDPPFTSTSYGEASASRFGFMPIQLHLHVTEGVRGVPAKPFSLNPAENEIILAPNTRFLVLGITVDEDGKHHVDMAVLPNA